MSSGSTPLPKDLDILRPSPSWIIAWMKTSLKGAGPTSPDREGGVSCSPGLSEDRSLTVAARCSSSPRKYRLNMVMRETHSVMISRAVVSTEVGLNAARSDSKSAIPDESLAAVASGQPIVLSGQRAEENQVSRTSGSWVKPAASKFLISGFSLSRKHAYTDSVPSSCISRWIAGSSSESWNGS